MKDRSQHGGNIYNNELNREKIVELSSNINPMALPKSIYDALPSILDKAKNYPDIEYVELLESIANYLNRLINDSFIDKNMICLGNGATELIEAIISLNKSILIPVPSFYEYQRSANKYNVKMNFIYKYNNLDNINLDLNILDDEVFLKIENNIENFDSLILCNPNNPDGSKINIKYLEKLLINNKSKLFIIDETFGEYLEIGDMVLPLVKKHDNLIVIKALTKFFGLPGCRLGYAISNNKELLEKVNEKLPIWNINTFSEEIAKLMFLEEEYIKSSIIENKINHAYLFNRLNEDALLEKVFISSSDFIMVYDRKMPEIVEFLKKKNILIRSLSNMEGLNEYFSRIAVKEKEKTDILINALKEFRKNISK